MTPNKIDLDQVQLGFKGINDPGDVPVIVAVLFVFLLYLTAVVFARRADKRDLEKVRLLNMTYMDNICVCHFLFNLSYARVSYTALEYMPILPKSTVFSG